MADAFDQAQPVREALHALQNLVTPALRDRWSSVFGRPAPKRMGRDLLLRALAYDIQERLEGGLSKAARKRLAAAPGPGGDGDAGSPVIRPMPGTRLVREWRGEAHHVTIVEGGFEYRGELYRSLSQIARTITGTRWSGPLFFGLRKPIPDNCPES